MGFCENVILLSDVGFCEDVILVSDVGYEDIIDVIVLNVEFHAHYTIHNIGNRCM